MKFYYLGISFILYLYLFWCFLIWFNSYSKSSFLPFCNNACAESLFIVKQSGIFFIDIADGVSIGLLIVFVSFGLSCMVSPLKYMVNDDNYFFVSNYISVKLWNYDILNIKFFYKLKSKIFVYLNAKSILEKIVKRWNTTLKETKKLKRLDRHLPILLEILIV